MLWIKVHHSIGNHRKVIKAAEVLRVREAEVIGYLVLLWLWAMENTRTGVIDVEKKTIARVCRWHRTPAELVEGLILARFLDRLEDGTYKVVNFEKHISPVLVTANRNRVRQAEFRRKREEAIFGTAGEQNPAAQ